MRRFCLFIFFLFSCLSLYGQKERVLLYTEGDRRQFNFGIQLGVGFMSYYIQPSDYKGLTPYGSQNVNDISGIGYEIAAIGAYNFAKYFSLKFSPGVYLANSSLSWENELPIAHLESLRELQTFYAAMPLYLRIGSQRMNNIKPFVEFGGGLLFNMTGKQYDGRDNYEGLFRVRPANSFVQAGFGVELYNRYFKLGAALKGMWGLNSVLIPDYAIPSEYTSPILSMKMRGCFLSLTFE